jgi:hypothetical protein
LKTKKDHNDVGLCFFVTILNERSVNIFRDLFSSTRLPVKFVVCKFVV